MGYFYDGFGIPGETGDVIRLEGGSSTARIVRIDYTNRTLTLDQVDHLDPRPIPASPVFGVRPDMGAFELQSGTLHPAPAMNLKITRKGGIMQRMETKSARWGYMGSLRSAVVDLLGFSGFPAAEEVGVEISSGPAISPKPLSWNAPTQFADGGALDPSKDLSSYEIYINETGNFLPSDTPKAISPAVDASSGTPVTTFDLAKITPSLQGGKTYYVAMRTVETNGGKSGFSDPPIRFVY